MINTYFDFIIDFKNYLVSPGIFLFWFDSVYDGTLISFDCILRLYVFYLMD